MTTTLDQCELIPMPKSITSTDAVAALEPSLHIINLCFLSFGAPVNILLFKHGGNRRNYIHVIATIIHIGSSKYLFSQNSVENIFIHLKSSNMDLTRRSQEEKKIDASICKHTHTQRIYVFSAPNILFDHIWQLNDNHIHLECVAVLLSIYQMVGTLKCGNLYWALFWKFPIVSIWCHFLNNLALNNCAHSMYTMRWVSNEGS